VIQMYSLLGMALCHEKHMNANLEKDEVKQIQHQCLEFLLHIDKLNVDFKTTMEIITEKIIALKESRQD